MRAEEVWTCGDCGSMHEFELDARACCPVKVAQQWTCGDCDYLWETLVDAEACCQSKEEKK